MKLKSIVSMILFGCILTIVAACGQFDQKTFSGTTSDDLGLEYTLTLKFNSELDSQWHLTAKPKEITKFVSIIKRKREDAKRVQQGAYENIKKYCELTREKTACDSLAAMEQEMNQQKVAISYSITLLDQNGAVIENLNLNQQHDLGLLENSQKTPLEMKNSFKIGRKNFARIAKVDLKSKF